MALGVGQNSVDGSNVGVALGVGEVPGEDGTAVGIDLDLPDRPDAGSLKAQIKTRRYR